MTLSPRAAGPSGGWTDDAVETLTRLWRAGDLSAAMIARRLGVTRNAVLGKIHRLGLSATRATRSTPRAPPRAPPARPRRPRRVSLPPPTPAPQPAALMALAQSGPGLVARLEDLPRGACHWPLGDPQAADFLFCGRRAEVGPYCPAHAGLAYRGRALDVAELARLLRS